MKMNLFSMGLIHFTNIIIFFLSSANCDNITRHDLITEIMMKDVVMVFPAASFDEKESYFRQAVEMKDDPILRRGRRKNLWDYSLSQFKEDIWAYENWFYKMANGTILETGALDGHQHSNSYFFDTFLGWQSIHIEANKHSFKRLIHNRPNSLNIHSALCDERREFRFLTHWKYPAVGGIYEFMAPDYIKTWFPGINSVADLKDEPTVQCVRLSSIFQNIRIDHIDIWILDVEGAELQGMDFNRVNISTIVMEGGNTNKTIDVMKVDYLKKYGYSCQERLKYDGLVLDHTKLFLPKHANIPEDLCLNSANKQEAEISKKTNETSSKLDITSMGFAINISFVSKVTSVEEIRRNRISISHIQ
eukprot:gene9071-18793_t